MRAPCVHVSRRTPVSLERCLGQIRALRRAVRNSRGPLISRRFLFACSFFVAEASARRSMASPAKSEAFAANLAVIRRVEALASACAKSRRMASERVTAPCSRRHRSICCNNCLGNSFGVTTSRRAPRRRGRMRGNTADFFMGYFTAITTSQPAPGRSTRSRVK